MEGVFIRLIGTEFLEYAEYDAKEVGMAITPVEDLFTHQCHQAYNRSMLTGASSIRILRMAHYMVQVLNVLFLV